MNYFLNLLRPISCILLFICAFIVCLFRQPSIFIFWIYFHHIFSSWAGRFSLILRWCFVASDSIPSVGFDRLMFSLFYKRIFFVFKINLMAFIRWPMSSPSDGTLTVFFFFVVQLVACAALYNVKLLFANFIFWPCNFSFLPFEARSAVLYQPRCTWTEIFHGIFFDEICKFWIKKWNCWRKQTL